MDGKYPSWSDVCVYWCRSFPLSQDYGHGGQNHVFKFMTSLIKTEIWLSWFIATLNKELCQHLILFTLFYLSHILWYSLSESDVPWSNTFKCVRKGAQRDKQCLTKHVMKNWKWTHVLRKVKQFLFHSLHPLN